MVPILKKREKLRDFTPQIAFAPGLIFISIAQCVAWRKYFLNQTLYVFHVTHAKKCLPAVCLYC